MSKLESLILKAKRLKYKPVAAVVMPDDDSTRDAVERALDAGFARFIIVGDRQRAVERFASVAGRYSLPIVEAEDAVSAANTAAALVESGRADLIMKGLVNTDILLKAVLNKERGFIEPGKVLTHIAIADIPSHHKLLFFTDPAVLPSPSADQREAQLRYLVDVCAAIGVERPRVALVHCSEKVDERHFPITGEYRQLVEKVNCGEFGDCVVDGPFDLKTSCDTHAAQVKGISSPLNGDADALIFPDIESANVFYKAITLFSSATTASMVYGARMPVVVPSRGDNADTKFYSLATACLAFTSKH